ncbi:MAG: RHS repeat protein, partial [Chloroflexi bacterium]|nr:RHS repeat protein [Chloroflexota bacterium]
TSVADRNGNTLTIAYSGSNPTTITAPGGRQLTITVDGSGRVTQIAAPASLTATYTYDGSGNLATATDAAGKVTRYTYDARHQLTQMDEGTAAAGFKVVGGTTYGTLGRAATATGGQIAGGAWIATSTFTYANQGYSGSWGGAGIVVSPRGTPIWYYNDASLRLVQREVYTPGQGGALALTQRLQSTYDTNDNVISATDGNGRVATSTYDTANTELKARGNRLSTTVDAGMGGLNLTTTYTYNGSNDLLTETDPLSHTKTFTYNSAGSLLTAANALGYTTTYTYTSFGQRLTMTDATSNQTTYGYNTQGDLTTTTNPGSFVWTKTYDAAGRLLTSATPISGTTTTYTYDGMGRVLTVTDPVSHTVVVYDMDRNPIEIQVPHVTTTTYDAYGNRGSVTDQQNHTTSYEYDVMHRLTAVVDAKNGRTTYAYDAAGNQTSTTNALGSGHTWTTTYDALNRKASASDPLGNTVLYTYDAMNTLTQVRKADLVVNRFAYDRVYRLTGQDLGNDSTLDIQFTYDNAGRRTSMTDGTGTTTYTYDNADRLTSVTAPVTGTVSYAYDNANRLTTLTYPSTHAVSYGYNSRGLLTTVTDWQSNVTTYGYDNAGRRTSLVPPNGQPQAAYTYDGANRLLTLTYTKQTSRGPETVLGFTYTYDPAGNVLTDSGTTYTYDELNRLTSAAYPSVGTTTYTYDAVGNRLTAVAGTTTSYTYDNADRMLTAGATTYTYDANGNQITQTTGGTTTIFTYDKLNRLTAISAPVNASYAYNGDGLRVAKTVGGTTTRDTWATVFGMPQVVSDGTNEYVWAKELLSQKPISGGTRFAATDRLGSQRLLTDTSGTSVGTVQYDAFGNVQTQTGTLAPFDYTGGRRDTESGLIYPRARYYDPAAGRFITTDPVLGCATNPLSQNRYAYTQANPTRYVDPRGTSVEAPELSADPPGNPDFRPLTPKVRTQAALDDGICSIAEPGSCLAAILNAGLGAKYIANYYDFFGQEDANGPGNWGIPVPNWLCKASCRALCYASFAFGCVSVGATAAGFCILGTPAFAAGCGTVAAWVCTIGVALADTNDCGSKCIKNNCWRRRGGVRMSPTMSSTP